jgi:hypothetical protein
MGSSFVSRATEVWVSAACPSANASPRRVREHGDCRDMRNSRESRESQDDGRRGTVGGCARAGRAGTDCELLN